ncbi:hypothetical protein [Catenuloplanes japonicus]|uniref:hypothetical protein n=1 Tax=Catenuloplanes japonicus TaxID=33876 RepID=UPI000527999D|nr:hypothetical protein [Catenuloplanes japonicus]
MTSELSPWTRVAAAVALLTLIISVLLTAFAWPAANSSVHDVPIGLAGPAAATDQVAAALEQRQPGAFEIHRFADTAAAETAIREREVYGAIDLSTGAPQVIVASAASPIIAQTLQGVATALGQAAAPAPAVPVRDLVALPAEDPRGTGLTAASLPLVMGGMLAAILLTNMLRGASRRLTGAVLFAITGGLALTAILQFWFGSLSGDYLVNAGAVALSIGATSMVILGLESLIGYLGFAIGGVTMMLIGNPLAGTGSAPQMLPGWSGELGQLLPPGAAASLLRSTAFFDGHGATHAIVVLVVWLAAGGVLFALGSWRSARRSGVVTAPEAVPVPA